tara:strand:+ start:393 stop:1049 length:657 start_codon:yes stop_codon:yes gene_type:complete
VKNMIDFLYNYAKNIYSANGEDGINQKIIDHLNIKNGVVLEIGAWDGFFDSNCANLWSDGSHNGILIEATNRLDIEKLESKYDNINCFIEMITSDNTLENIIDKCKFEVNNDNFVLASIDVDGDDLNVARSLGKYKPIILIIEPNGDVIKKQNPNGSSIKELLDFGSDFGYEFIGMSGLVGRQSGNVYLVRNDYKSKFDICSKPWQQRGIILSEGVLY